MMDDSGTAPLKTIWTGQVNTEGFMWRWHGVTTCWIRARVCARPSVISGVISEGSRGHTKAFFGKLLAAWRLNEDIFLGKWTARTISNISSSISSRLGGPQFISLLDTDGTKCCQALNSAGANSLPIPVIKQDKEALKSTCLHTGHTHRVIHSHVRANNVPYLWRTGRSWEQTEARWAEAAPRTIRPAGPAARIGCPTTLSVC